jgi:Protein of unknown function (DUF1559)
MKAVEPKLARAPAICRAPHHSVVPSAAPVTLSAAKSLMRRRPATTLLELLVVVAIIAMLTGLSLPAINAARESGRATVCKNNLRQIALAALLHENAQGYYASGGWAGGWSPVPGRGFGPSQPGGPFYSLLGYLERNDLAELGKESPQGQREAAVAKLLQTPIAVLNCPSRRRPDAYPIYYDYARTPLGATLVNFAARADYAMNAGDQPRCDLNWLGPPSLAAGDDPQFAWPDVSDHTGICYMRSRVAAAQVRDGLSRTYLVAEKYLSVSNYDTGADQSDDWSMYAGYQDDVCRTTFLPPARDGDELRTCRFGSSHPAVWHVAFCDAAVRALSYQIDRKIHRSLGNRADGMVFDDSGIK